ncbi:MAG: HXXEE domain-containing protein [Pseudomonadota bacterium]
MNQRIAIAALTLFFGALWLPLGQEAFLAENWMKVGTFAAPLILFVAFALRDPADPPRLDDVQLVAVAMAAGYMAHQFEEHWIDLLGRLYPLRQVLNDIMSATYGPEAAEAMTPEAIFFVNTSVVWLIAVLAVLRGRVHVFPALAMAGVMAVNGVAHVVVAVVSVAYNPGLLTSVVIFLPLSLGFYGVLLRQGTVSALMVGAGLAWAVLAHALLFGGLIAANVLGLFPVSLYYALLIVWALVPLAMFRQRQAATG